MGKKREKKTSKGINGGGGKYRMSELDKALIVPAHLERIGAARSRRLGKPAKPGSPSKADTGA